MTSKALGQGVWTILIALSMKSLMKKFAYFRVVTITIESTKQKIFPSHFVAIPQKTFVYSAHKTNSLFLLLIF